MWWYRGRKPGDEPEPQPAGAGPARPAAPPRPASPRQAAPGLRTDVVVAVRDALTGRPADPDAWLAMSLLVDGVLEMTSGAPVEGLPVQEAERHVVEAWSGRSSAVHGEAPLRLYNRFTKDFGEGYSSRADLPESHRAALTALRTALASAPGVRSYRPR